MTAKADAGTRAGQLLQEELFGLVSYRVPAAIRALRGVRDVKVHTRSRMRHVIQVEMPDGTVRNFTVQIIEHR